MNVIAEPSSAIASLAADSGTATSWSLVKGDDLAPIWYTFDVLGSVDVMDIELTAFRTGEAGMSHVSIYAVPEPGALALLGLILLGAGFSRRRKAA